MMHIPKSTISAYENDKVDIKGSVIVELSEYLDTTPNYLLGVSDKTEDPFIKIATELLGEIKDEGTKNVLLIQLRALADIKE